MTREEAIEALTSKDVCNSDMMLEALDMAIEALEREPCDDAISRQQVKSDYADWYGYGYQDNWFYKYLNSIPSVNPQESCDTCEQSDEIDGNNCYECVKGMRNNYSSKKQEPLNDVLNEIRAEVDRQYKWLINTNYTICDVDIAFGSIFRTIEKYRK